MSALVPYYTQTSTIYAPDERIMPRESLRYEAIRGYSAIVLAFDNDRAIGWTDTRDLGFETAREWRDAQRDQLWEAKTDGETPPDCF
jgi:hypothetical protein